MLSPIYLCNISKSSAKLSMWMLVLWGANCVFIQSKWALSCLALFYVIDCYGIIPPQTLPTAHFRKWMIEDRNKIEVTNLNRLNYTNTDQIYSFFICIMIFIWSLNNWVSAILSLRVQAFPNACSCFAARENTLLLEIWNFDYHHFFQPYLG